MSKQLVVLSCSVMLILTLMLVMECVCHIITQFSGNMGGWSQEGGSLVNQTDFTTTCAFSHNTDYTVLQVWLALCIKTCDAWLEQ